MRVQFFHLLVMLETARRLSRFLVRMHNPQDLVLVERVSEKGDPPSHFSLQSRLRRLEPKRQRLFGLSQL